MSRAPTRVFSESNNGEPLSSECRSSQASFAPSAPANFDFLDKSNGVSISSGVGGGGIAVPTR